MKEIVERKEHFYKRGKTMSKGICPKCDKIVIENLEEYRKKYPKEKLIQCPYCLKFMEIENEF